MDVRKFTRELEALRAFRGEHVGSNLLEALEKSRLLIPQIRIRYPDPVARRFWAEAHDERMHQLKLPMEPDSPRWENAVELSNRIYRGRNRSAYGPSVHPLDKPEPHFAEFIQYPAMMDFEPWLDTRIDVSNDVYPELLDNGNVETYYTTWQILVAAEVADAGVHFRINLADDDIFHAVQEALHNGLAPANSFSLNFLPVHVARDFAQNEPALNAVVWFAEECEYTLTEILKGQGGGRFRLSEQQETTYQQACRDAAKAATNQYQISTDELVALCRLLARRWLDWNRQGRPLIADAYKDFLGESVQLTKLIGDLTFVEIRDRVEHASTRGRPILDEIWPNWSEREKDRVRLTLKAALKQQDTNDVSEADIDAFVNFLEERGLEAFFWRLNSFESHAFRGNEFALEGMKSDLQGMAVAVEHVAGALGGTETQLYEKFKQLWRNPNVLRLLKRVDISSLARQKRNWAEFKVQLEALRQEQGGKTAADLVLAYRIRGGVHTTLPEDDQFELQGLFVALMRAAVLTFVEVRRSPAIALR